jgi:glycyl-tRNA synthetase beta chain
MEFLLEINTEEMPASHVKAGLAQLKEKIGAELEARRVAARWLEACGTCRRLVVAGEVAARQEDREETIIGPPKAAAFGPDGSPAAAARGFARAQNMDVERLQVIETPRGQYVGLKKIVQGRPTSEILAEALPGIITSLSFPKMMKWGESCLRFSRPIKNILCFWGGEVLPFSVGGIVASDSTTGHRLHAPGKIKIKKPRAGGLFQAYRSLLKRGQVVVAADDRKRLILSQIEKKLRPLGAELYPDDELLEKLSYDVEWPHVILGHFPEEYLNLPIEVLSMAMREGQKLFSVVQSSKQLPNFIGVSDTAGDPKSLIRRGNERVLKARLEDARFFWQQDRKIPLLQRRPGLSQVVFQQKLGSYADKTERLKEIAAYLCDELGEEKLKADAVQAAELAKVDLLTEMVREFPALQGKVGGLYAREEGYPEAVWRAIYEHYEPLSLEDSPPRTMAGSVLSLADKIDSIAGAIRIGTQVTGSSDPFGLRRSAHGVAQIILERGFALSFPGLLEKAASNFGRGLEPGRSRDEVVDVCLKFFEQRLRYIFESQGFRYDLVNAALGAGLDDLYFCRLRLQALDALQKSPGFVPLVLMAKRVNNILREAEPPQVNAALFSDKDERLLHDSFKSVEKRTDPLLAAGRFEEAQNVILDLQAPLSAFFDRVLVMAQDPQIRDNRLAILRDIRRLMSRVADYAQVVVEGEKTG